MTIQEDIKALERGLGGSGTAGVDRQISMFVFSWVETELLDLPDGLVDLRLINLIHTTSTTVRM